MPARVSEQVFHMGRSNDFIVRIERAEKNKARGSEQANIRRKFAFYVLWINTLDPQLETREVIFWFRLCDYCMSDHIHVTKLATSSLTFQYASALDTEMIKYIYLIKYTI